MEAANDVRIRMMCADYLLAVVHASCDGGAVCFDFVQFEQLQPQQQQQQMEQLHIAHTKTTKHTLQQTAHISIIVKVWQVRGG